jgi:hypothetical protein
MPRTVRIFTRDEYNEILDYLKGCYTPANPVKRLSMKRKCRDLSIKKGIDSLTIAMGLKEVIAEYDVDKKHAILHACHDLVGHPGREVTYKYIFNRYIGIRKKDVTEYIAKCKFCPRKDMLRQSEPTESFVSSPSESVPSSPEPMFGGESYLCRGGSNLFNKFHTLTYFDYRVHK